MQSYPADASVIKSVLQSYADALRPKACKYGLNFTVSERSRERVRVISRIADRSAQVLRASRLGGIRAGCVVAAGLHLETEPALGVRPGLISGVAFADALDEHWFGRLGAILERYLAGEKNSLLLRVAHRRRGLANGCRRSSQCNGSDTRQSEINRLHSVIMLLFSVNWGSDPRRERCGSDGR